MLAATVTVVVALGIIIGIAVASLGHHQRSAATGGDANGLIGPRWTLSGVRSATRNYPVPAGYHADLGFAKNGRLTGRDGLNGLNGTYHVSPEKITIRVTAVGTAGTTHTFPALDAMASTYVPTALNDGAVTSTYTLTAHTLALDTGRWIVTFTAHETGGSETSIPSSSTPTA